MPESAIRPRVVIAEDYVLIQENIRLLLQQECDVVAVVEDGEGALQAVSLHAPDVLVIDISLPGIGGFAVAEKLHTERPEVKVIFVTAHRDKSYADRSFEIGVKGYVLKGRMQTELPAAIRQVMSGGQYRSPLLP